MKNSKIDEQYKKSIDLEKYKDMVIKELMIDWEDVLSPSFNPLHYVLRINKNSRIEAEFREMFHKLDKAMNSIISNNHNMFKQMILNYLEVNNINDNNSRMFDEILKSLEQIKNKEINMKAIYKNHKEIELYDIKYRICNSIQRINNIFNELKECDDLFAKATMIVECLDILDESKWLEIKGVMEFRKHVYKQYEEIAMYVILRISDFIFKNRIENMLYFKALRTLGCLYQLETYFSENFKARLFEEIELSIFNCENNFTNIENTTSYNNNFHSNPSALKVIDLNSKIVRVAKSVIEKVETIKENMATLISKINSYFVIGKNGDYEEIYHKRLVNLFFGEECMHYKFCRYISHTVEIINKELTSFITTYSKTFRKGKLSFNLNYIYDYSFHNTIDIYNYSNKYNYKYHNNNKYNNQYDNNNNYSSNLNDDNNNNNSIIYYEKNEYSLFTNTDDRIIEYLLAFSKDFEIKTFLEEQFESKYSSNNLANEIEIIDHTISKESFHINNNTGRLIICDVIETLFANKPKEYLRQLREVVIDKICTFFHAKHSFLFPSEIIRQQNKSFKDLENLNSKNIDTETLENTKNEGFKVKSDDFMNFYRYKLIEILVKKHIKKKDLFIKAELYKKAIAAIKTLEDIDYFCDSAKIRSLHALYFYSTKTQIILDLLYFYGIMFRQGNYKFYTKKITHLITILYKEVHSTILFDGIHKVIIDFSLKNINSMNVHSISDLKEFLENLKIIDEIMGELEINASFSELYSIYDSVLENNPKDQFAKEILKKITISESKSVN